MGRPRYVAAALAADRRRSTTPTGSRRRSGCCVPTARSGTRVPTVLGTTGQRAQAFAAAWDHWVGGGPAIYTGSPEGEGVLVTHRGNDPFAATTVLRTSWR